MNIMNKILICGVNEIPSMFKLHNISVIISICDPIQSLNDCAKEKQFRDFLHNHSITHSFYFKDFRKRKPIGIGTSENTNIPSIEDVIRMKELAPSLKDQTVLFHCTAGISRSTAFAYILLREQGFSSDETFKKLLQIRPISSPNPRITYIYENLCNLI
jgi:predicted protein tyrosine phosphatase